ncbi:hypothetical protein O0L34_g13673 [Tuta absoluta]|nr:hypothetical protein O0L34_g13673 [Tuta absoluta]
MKSSVEVRCIVCQLVFCCADCRWNHEKNTHGLQFDCPICRGFSYLCKPKELNEHFKQHLAEEHLPLKCHKCNKIFKTMEDLTKIDECNSISELIEIENKSLETVDDKFNNIYENNNNEPEIEAMISVDKFTKTAVITPIVRKKYNPLVDYEDSDDEHSFKPELLKTPHAKLVPKTPKAKKQRVNTPHVKKLLLLRQKRIEDAENAEYEEDDEPTNCPKTTPMRNEKETDLDPEREMTTPTSHLPHLAKLVQAVTTSTPTNVGVGGVGGWSMFDSQGADSPLSEIENAGSPSQTDNQPSKTESSTAAPKLKSIIVTGSRIRLGSQDSSEKQVTFQDSVETSSVKVKKVKFAEDTVFEQENKVKRVFRKPKRMLTPGPQRPKYFVNPRFQALINRFEHQGITMARTPVNTNRVPEDSTPPVPEHSNMPARAINFKEDSPIIEPENYSKESNELFKTCVDSPEIQTPDINNAITTLTANIAGSLQNCLGSALRATDEETEIQFKFVITRKKVSVKRIGDSEGVGGKSSEIETVSNKENIWSSVAKAVKTVFWGEGTNLDATTPHRSYNSSEGSSASKRKFEEMSDNEFSPLNHKRHKYEGRIRGRPPLRRSKTWVSSLRSSHSAEQSGLVQRVGDADDAMNQSF